MITTETLESVFQKETQVAVPGNMVQSSPELSDGENKTSVRSAGLGTGEEHAEAQMAECITSAAACTSQFDKLCRK